MKYALVLIDFESVYKRNVILANQNSVVLLSTVDLAHGIGTGKYEITNIDCDKIKSLINDTTYGEVKVVDNILNNSKNMLIPSLVRRYLSRNEAEEGVSVAVHDFQTYIHYAYDKETKCYNIIQSYEKMVSAKAYVGIKGTNHVDMTNTDNIMSYVDSNLSNIDWNSIKTDTTSGIKHKIARMVKYTTQTAVTNSSLTDEQRINSAEATESTVNTFSFDDEETDTQEKEEFKFTYTEFKKDCPYCHGTGIREENGIQQECECGRRLAEEEQRKKELELNKAQTSIVKATELDVVSLGLVPKEYADKEYNSKSSYASMQRVAKGRNIFGAARYIGAMNSIIAACKTGKKLKHSYLIAGDSGFSKKTFVYTCIKYMYQRGEHPVHYKSLTEIGLLRADVVKNAQAVTSAGYYYRDTNMELLQTIMEKSANTLINTIIGKTYNVLRDELEVGGESVAEANATANHILNLNNTCGITTKEELKLRNVERGRDIWNNVRTRVLEEVQAKYKQVYNDGIDGYDRDIDKHINEQVDTWRDIVETPLLFTFFSGSLNKHYETEVLQMLLHERGVKCLPTVVLLDNTIQIYADGLGYAEDTNGNSHIAELKTKSYYWNSMLSDASKFNIKEINMNDLDNEIDDTVEYDKLVYIPSFISRENDVHVGVNI